MSVFEKLSKALAGLCGWFITVINRTYDFNLQFNLLYFNLGRNWNGLLQNLFPDYLCTLVSKQLHQILKNVYIYIHTEV